MNEEGESKRGKKQPIEGAGVILHTYMGLFYRGAAWSRLLHTIAKKIYAFYIKNNFTEMIENNFKTLVSFF